jgi:hypothetical protein
MVKRLSTINADYWRTHSAPHIRWLNDNIDEVKKRAMVEYEAEFQELEIPILCGAVDTTAADMIQECYRRYNIPDLLALRDKWSRQRQDKLQHLAKFVDFETDGNFHLLRRSKKVKEYSKYKDRVEDYAKGELAPYEDALKSRGFVTNVSPKQDEGDYILWGNCLPWMFDALARQVTLPDALKSFETRNLESGAYGLRGFLR